MKRNVKVWAEKVIDVAEAFKGSGDRRHLRLQRITNEVIASLEANFEVCRRFSDLPDIGEIVEKVQRESDDISSKAFEKVHSMVAELLFDGRQKAGPRLYGTWDWWSGNWWS
ncbi:hypothetical protein [Mesorhizobium sp.]|uniref:hypothetical protein n=1 Tax=Mesorhizobium sp. TaxID=1871066 RepID=UPI000FE9A26A|nr:hypothetical protein [Mesorhizobium sp.]RWN50290.1 MAG: hypothetical protein EOR98_32575 [Mesorhizobium sp.]